MLLLLTVLLCVLCELLDHVFIRGVETAFGDLAAVVQMHLRVIQRGAPAFSLVRVVQAPLKSSSVAPSMTWKNNARTRSCSFLGFAHIASDETLQTKDCQTAETLNNGGIEELFWVANGLVAMKSAERPSGLSDADNARNAMTRGLWTSSMEGSEVVHAYNLASAFDPSLATATVPHHKPNAMTL